MVCMSAVRIISPSVAVDDALCRASMLCIGVVGAARRPQCFGDVGVPALWEE